MYSTLKVFNIQKMPKDIKRKVLYLFEGESNDSYVQFCVTERDEDGLISQWLIANGATEYEEVLLNLNW